MQNQAAIIGLRQILSKLESNDLFGLAATVTQGLLRNKLDTKNEVVDAILMHSPNEISVLKRKVITRDILFSYLHENEISVKLPVTKNDLISKICEYWKIRYKDIENRDNFLVSRQDENKHIAQLNDPISQDLQIKECETDTNAMAKQFCEWFYSMMNENVPIGEEHFWQDARIKVNMIAGTQTITEMANNNTSELVQLLFKIRRDHTLYFNPNLLKEGVQGRMQPHGLVVVVACGTLHRDSLCVGIFEQMFMLARDPFSDNNWKIKVTELNLKSKNEVQSPPTLSDSNLTSNVLALPLS